MTAAISRLVSPRREMLLAGALALVAAAVLLVLAPPMGDAPAHLYRTLLVKQGVLVWDNLWYGGHYPLASYSLLYYLPAAVVGNVPLVFAAAVLSAAFFALLVEREWGPAGIWPARSFAVLAAGPVFFGTYTYALGLAAGLGTLLALQRGRRWTATAAAALTLGFSPLAFVFLCLALVAIALARGRLGRNGVFFSFVIVAIGAVQFAVLVFFPSSGPYPFGLLELSAVLTVSILGGALARRARHGALLAAFFLVWGSASLLMFAFATPIGENLARLRMFVFPLMLLTALLAKFRPRFLAGLALAAALTYNVAPVRLGGGRPHRHAAGGRVLLGAGAAVPQDALEPELPRRGRPDLRPLGGVLAPEGRLSARPRLVPADRHRPQRALLRASADRRPLPRVAAADGRAVRPAAEHRARPEGGEARGRAAAVGTGRAELVFSNASMSIWELPRPDPILTGPGRPTVTRLDHSRVEGTLTKSGVYALKVQYTRYWRVRSGAVCLERGGGGMTRLRATRPGPFALSVPEEPNDLVGLLVGRPPGHC